MLNGGLLSFVLGGVFVVALELLLIRGFVDAVAASFDSFVTTLFGWL